MDNFDTNLFEPHVLPCGCCTNGCMCREHSSVKNFAREPLAITCGYHRDDQMRKVFVDECRAQGTGT